MDKAEIEEFIKDSYKDGYEVEEIEEALREEGVNERKIKESMKELEKRLNNQKTPENSSQNQISTDSNNNQPRIQQSQRKDKDFGGGHRDVIKKIDLTSDSYLIKQRFFLNRYHIYSDGNMVAKAKQKLLNLKEDFPIMDTDDNVVARVKAESIVDAGGDYTLTDEETGNPIAVLDRKYSLFRHKWKIRDSNTEEKLAEVESSQKTIELIRWIGNIVPYFPNVFGLIPHTYVVKGQNGEKLASLEGQLSIRDKYEINIHKTGEIPKEALVASSIAIDALEGN